MEERKERKIGKEGKEGKKGNISNIQEEEPVVFVMTHHSIQAFWAQQKHNRKVLLLFLDSPMGNPIVNIIRYNYLLC